MVILNKKLFISYIIQKRMKISPKILATAAALAIIITGSIGIGLYFLQGSLASTLQPDWQIELQNVASSNLPILELNDQEIVYVSETNEISTQVVKIHAGLDEPIEWSIDIGYPVVKFTQKGDYILLLLEVENPFRKTAIFNKDIYKPLLGVAVVNITTGELVYKYEENRAGRIDFAAEKIGDLPIESFANIFKNRLVIANRYSNAISVIRYDLSNQKLIDNESYDLGNSESGQTDVLISSLGVLVHKQGIQNNEKAAGFGPSAPTPRAAASNDFYYLATYGVEGVEQWLRLKPQTQWLNLGSLLNRDKLDQFVLQSYLDEDFENQQNQIRIYNIDPTKDTNNKVALDHSIDLSEHMSKAEQRNRTGQLNNYQVSNSLLVANSNDYLFFVDTKEGRLIKAVETSSTVKKILIQPNPLDTRVITLDDAGITLYNVEGNVLKSLSFSDLGFNPDAINDNTQVSLSSLVADEKVLIAIQVENHLTIIHQEEIIFSEDILNESGWAVSPKGYVAHTEKGIVINYLGGQESIIDPENDSVKIIAGEDNMYVLNGNQLSRY
jgi:hypothetical protein